MKSHCGVKKPGFVFFWNRTVGERGEKTACALSGLGSSRAMLLLSCQEKQGNEERV